MHPTFSPQYQPQMQFQTQPARTSYVQLQEFDPRNSNIEQIDSTPQSNATGLMDQEESAELGFQALDMQEGIFIQQKLDVVEVIFGCETQNTYSVHSLDQSDEKVGPKVFTCKEKSGFCQRQLLTGNCRPFRMNISTVKLFEGANIDEPFLSLERPCKCTFLCSNRPELSVSLIEKGQSEYLGKIVHPFRFFDMELHVLDKNNNHKYTILGSCKQLAFWCSQYPCEPCQTLDFRITTASGEGIGYVQRRSQGCLKAWLSDADSFAVKFPQNCLASDKALLMSAVLFLDYNYFERRKNRR